MKIVFPVCELCKDPDPVRCPLCGGFFCSSCTIPPRNEDSDCEHTIWTAFERIEDVDDQNKRY